MHYSYKQLLTFASDSEYLMLILEVDRIYQHFFNETFSFYL